MIFRKLKKDIQLSIKPFYRQAVQQTHSDVLHKEDKLQKFISKKDGYWKSSVSNHWKDGEEKVI